MNVKMKGNQRIAYLVPRISYREIGRDAKGEIHGNLLAYAREIRRNLFAAAHEINRNL